MLQKTLSALLVSVANRYAELSPSDVGIGIGGGRLVIDNVKLRAETFNSEALPFYVHQGRAGRLRINVPWSALSSSPVEVYLENVNLIAAPKMTSHHVRPSPQEVASPPPLGPKERTGNAEEKFGKRDWHQTMVGRLLFNVSIEMFGIKLEYRDDHCISILSVASLRAFSAGPDWKIQFVSLVEDSDLHIPHSTTTAVAMRKLVKLSGVHCVMIPLLKPKTSQSSDSAPELDRHSFESKAPIVDGIAVTVRVLLCTGAAYTQASPNNLTTGLHAEVDVDLEDPKLSLTARQIEWIDHILKQGFGIGADRVNTPTHFPAPYASSLPLQKRRPRRPIPPELSRPSVHAEAEVGNGQHQAMPMASRNYSTSPHSPATSPPPPSDSESVNSAQIVESAGHDLYRDEDIDAEIEEISDFIDDGKSDNEPASSLNEPSSGGLQSFWRAIVSENGDETIDDAAVALGLTSVNDESGKVFDDGPDPGEGHADLLFARDAVEAAANAGGATFQLRIRTPDMAAWDEVENLRISLRKEQDFRGRLENIEAVLEEAERRVRSSEEEVRQLKERNEALVRELKDLEQLTSQAGKNKDAVIRQMEASLASAERRLQQMFRSESSRDLPERGSSTEDGKGIPKSRRNGKGADFHSRSENDAGREGSEFAGEPGTGSQDLTGEVSIQADLRDPENGTNRTENHESNFGYKGHDNVQMKGGRPDLNALGSGPVEDRESSRARTEVAQRGHSHEMYFSKVSSHKLEGTVSLDGLTLI